MNDCLRRVLLVLMAAETLGTLEPTPMPSKGPGNDSAVWSAKLRIGLIGTAVGLSLFIGWYATGWYYRQYKRRRHMDTIKR